MLSIVQIRGLCALASCAYHNNFLSLTLFFGQDLKVEEAELSIRKEVFRKTRLDKESNEEQRDSLKAEVRELKKVSFMTFFKNLRDQTCLFEGSCYEM